VFWARREVWKPAARFLFCTVAEQGRRIVSGTGAFRAAGNSENGGALLICQVRGAGRRVVSKRVLFMYGAAARRRRCVFSNLRRQGGVFCFAEARRDGKGALEIAGKMCYIQRRRFLKEKYRITGKTRFYARVTEM